MPSSGAQTPPVILVIENDSANRVLAERILAMSPYRAIAVTNGQEALNVLAWQPVDLILTDLSMPVLDGATLIRLLRSRREFDHVPIVALTASAGHDERQRVLRLGCVEILTKPYRPRALLDLIARYIPPPAEDTHDDHPALFRRDP